MLHFILLFNVVVLGVLLIEIRKIGNDSKLISRLIINLVVVLLIINVFGLYNNAKIQSNYNTIAYNLYNLTSDSMRQVGQIAYEDTRSMEDIIALNQKIEEIHRHTHILLMQFDNLRVVSRSQHRQLFAIVNDMSEQLGIFLKYHSGIIARSEEISVEKFIMYDQLKLDLLYFEQKFRISGSSTSTWLGIMQQRLIVNDNNISRLQKITEDISELIKSLTSENL